MNCQLGKMGRCCCSCARRVVVLDHAAFPRKDVVGWGCSVGIEMDPLGEPVVYLGGFEHGLCELHARKREAYK